VGLKPSALQGEARLRVTRTPTVTLSTIGYQLSAISYRLSAIDYRLSAIGYRLSAIGYEQPSAMQGEARLRGRERNNYSKTINPPWLWISAPMPGIARMYSTSNAAGIEMNVTIAAGSARSAAALI